MPLKKYNTSSILVTNSSTHSSIGNSSELASTSPKSKSNTHNQNISNHLYTLSDLLPNIIETAVSCSASASATAGSASATVNSNNTNLNTSSSSSSSQDACSSSKLPNDVKNRLYDIFAQIEKEFDLLYAENARLRHQLNLCQEHKHSAESSELLNGASNSNNTNTSIHTNSSSTSTLVATTSNHFSPKKPSLESNEPKQQQLSNSNTISNLNPMTLSSMTNPTSTSSSAKSVITSKNRINNLSFPKFKPNAREFIMQSIKNTSAQIVNKTHNNLLNCKPQTALNGHKDGIWDINCVPIPAYLFKNSVNQNSLNQNLLIGTASADSTARLWFYNLHSISQNYSPSDRSTKTSLPSTNQSLSPQINHSQSQNQTISNAICIQEYSGHTGSVNSIRFHPRFFSGSTNLILTSSGDCQAHIWQCVLPQHNDGLDSTSELCLTYNNCYSYAATNCNSTALSSISSPNSNHSPSIANHSNNTNELFANPSVIRSPIKRYIGHQDACIAAEWFPDGEFLATASWDRTANVYNVETGKTLCNLQHDDHLTNVTIHKTYKIILTSSKDTTFKIWDFRDPICSVQIYQGHNRSVNSAIFIGDDKIATSSDDHTVKIWDLRIMRSPVCTINLNSGVNRLCTMNMSLDSGLSSSNETYLCLPLDNRDIKIYNLHGERINRLPRNSRVGHRRLVTSLASYNNMLFSASFDKVVNSWSFDYNPSKSSVSNKSNSNKENNELILQESTVDKTSKSLDKMSLTSPSILAQLSNLTSPNQTSNQALKTINSTTNSYKAISNNSTKLSERIKI